MKKYLQNSALFLSALVLAGFMCEGMFYLMNSYSPSLRGIETIEGVPVQETDFFQYHPIFGYSGVPNVRKQLYGKYITHNSKGFRGPEIEYQKAGGTKRLVFIGDSQTWGWGVSDSETIPYFTGKMLNEKASSNITYEALNFGASGYGIGQSYLRLIIEGLRYQPDYVVLTYFAENDLWETSSTSEWGVEKPYIYEKEDGNFCVSNVPPRRASGWPSDNLAFIAENKFNVKDLRFNLAGFEFDLANTQTAIYFKNRSINASLFSGWGGDDSDALGAIEEYIGCVQSEPGPALPTLEAKIDLVVKLILRIRETVEENGGEFFVATKPLEEDYRHNQQQPEYHAVLSALQQMGIKVIDVYSIAKGKSMAAEQLFINFGHLSAAGNRLIAESIAELILPQDGN